MQSHIVGAKYESVMTIPGAAPCSNNTSKKLTDCATGWNMNSMVAVQAGTSLHSPCSWSESCFRLACMRQHVHYFTDVSASRASQSGTLLPFKTADSVCLIYRNMTAICCMCHRRGVMTVLLHIHRVIVSCNNVSGLVCNEPTCKHCMVKQAPWTWPAHVVNHVHDGMSASRSVLTMIR